MNNSEHVHRRGFLWRTGAAGAAFAVGPPAWAKAGSVISLVLDGSDPVASARAARWAAHELQNALSGAGFTVTRHEYPQQAEPHSLCIIASGSRAPVAAAALKAARVTMPTAPESLALLQGTLLGRPAILACGADVRGLVYALLELADRVRLAPDTALKIEKPIVEQPTNLVRSVMRQFTSELYDKPWFYDRAMWPQYLGMLARQRFNRFNLSFGLGYDMMQDVEDAYFVFLYPFLLAAPGYDVRVADLPDEERDQNLQALRFISDQTVAHGLDFQLGIWMHGYETRDGIKYKVDGLTPETHAAYCSDALTALLKALPAVSSVALRIHGESGVAEGSYDFWKTVFDGVARCGRKVEIDLHAKGVDAQMIDTALATGMPVNLAPKFSAEHLGMPYHQAAIRELEMPVAGKVGSGLMALSTGARSFTRYGYADLLRDDRKYTVRHRVWPGTQHLLVSGNADTAAAYSRMFTFCGSTGADLMEPLTFRGRRGTGVAGVPRSGYAENRLEPEYDWEKYASWYRTFGRTMYNSDSDPDVFHRAFGNDAKAKAFESALANASRILPIVTTAHLPSAACDAYWPEAYWNQPMAGEPDPNPYGDTTAPKVFQNVSPLDPQLFSSMSEFAGEALGERSGKYSPIDVAQWLEGFAVATELDLAKAGKPKSVDFLRLAIDIEMQAGLGHFFAAKFRSGVLYAIHERTGDRNALAEAIGAYRSARVHFAQIADRAKGVYASDLSVSNRLSERGQWADRLAAIDADIAALNAKLAAATDSPDPRIATATRIALGSQKREPIACIHTPPTGFHPKQDVALKIAIARKLTSARLWYRHINQAERWACAEMAAETEGYRATIPADYSDSPYPLQYYFEFRDAPDKAWLHPGFDADLLNQPYFVLRRV